MATQFIDFTTPGATGDSNDNLSSAIKPIADNEIVTGANLGRAAENLRVRTELIRQAVNDMKYLVDADRALLLSGGGTITWGGGTTLSAGTGVFGITGPLTVRPFMAPKTSQPAGVWVSLAPGIVVLFNPLTAGKHAYDGGNEYTIKFTASGTFSVTMSGTPGNDVLVTTPASMTGDALIAALNGNVTFTATAGLKANSTVGSIPSDIIASGLILGTTLHLTGGIDAEYHTVKVADVSTFFGATENKLEEGDTVGIYYNSLVNGSGGGRRESVPDFGPTWTTDRTGAAGTSLELFNLRIHPEKAPLSIPLCTVVDDNLVFLNQVSVVRGQPQNGLASGFVQRSGDTMTGKLAVAPTMLGSAGGNLLSVTMPAERSTGVSTTTGDIAMYLNTGAGNAGGIDLVSAGAGHAINVTQSGLGRGMWLTSENVLGKETLRVAGVSATYPVLKAESAGAMPAIMAYSGDAGVPIPANTTVYVTGLAGHTLLKLRPAAGAVGGIGLEVTANGGGTSGGTGVKVLSFENALGIRVLHEGTDLAKPAVWVTAGTVGAANGLGIKLEGRQTIDYTGSGAAVTITPSDAAGYPLQIASRASALPTTTKGALGLEAYQPGTGATALSGARLMLGIGNSQLSCVRIAISMPSPWDTSTLYYWVSAEGVVHIRGNLVANPDQDIGPLDGQLIVGASVIPTTAKPLQAVTSLGVNGVGTLAAMLIGVNIGGSVTLEQRQGAAGSFRSSPVAIDYPLW